MDHSNQTSILQPGGHSAISDRMRELLARAAQDHVYEQRTQGAVLDEIRQRLEGMEWLLREVRERELGGLSGTLETVSGRLDDITARPPLWAEGLAQHVEAVRDHVDAVGEQVGGVDSRVESVSQRVHPIMELPRLRADLGTVCQGMEETLSRLQSVLDLTGEMAKQMGEFATRLTHVSAGMEVAAGRFNRLDKSLAELSTRADRVEGVVLDLSDTVEERVNGVEERLTGRLTEAERGLTGRLDALDGRLTDAAARDGERHTGLTTALAEAEERLTHRVDGLDAHLSGLATRAEQAGEALESVGRDIDRLPATLGVGELLDAQGERLAEATASLAEIVRSRPDRDALAETVSETVSGIVEPAASDLNRRLGALEETMLALAEALLRPSRPKD